jgi:hypothetical protein
MGSVGRRRELGRMRDDALAELVATPAGAFAVDMKVRVTPPVSEPAAYSRRLR